MDRNLLITFFVIAASLFLFVSPSFSGLDDIWLVCDSGRECTNKSFNGTTYYCYYSNAGNYEWSTSYPSTETACNDNHDNDCDGNIDSNDTDCQQCTYSLSIYPSSGSHQDTSKSWSINATDFSSPLCPSSITYSINYSTSGSCSANTKPDKSSFTISRGGSLSPAFSVYVERTGDNCTLDVEIKDPNGDVASTGSYSVSVSPSICGNGVVETGEVCDPPGSTNPTNECQECSSDCQSWVSKPNSTSCGTPGPWETDPTNECKERRATYHCSAGSCIFYQYEYRNKACGISCTDGRCSGAGTCYTYLGTQSNCPYLNCSIPELESGYRRVWKNSTCGRTGLYAVNPFQNVDPNATCALDSCDVTPGYTTLTGGWSSIAYPLPPDQYTYKVNDIIEIKINGITATSGFAPLLECRFQKFNENNEFVGGMYFNNWGTGDVIFSYRVKPNCEFCERYHGANCSNCLGSDLSLGSQTKACLSCSGGDAVACSNGCDPSGNWKIDYCILATDFMKNKGWYLKADWAGRTFCVSTLVIPG